MKPDISKDRRIPWVVLGGRGSS